MLGGYLAEQPGFLASCCIIEFASVLNLIWAKTCHLTGMCEVAGGKLSVVYEFVTSNGTHPFQDLMSQLHVINARRRLNVSRTRRRR